MTMVGTVVSNWSILEGRVVLDNNFMRHVYVLASKVLRFIAIMDGVSVPVDGLFTRIISFLGRLLFFLLWLFFLRILSALIHLLVSQLIRLPFMVSKVWIILNLRLRLIFVIMTLTDWRLVVIVVSMTLLNVVLFDLLNIMRRIQPG